MIGSDRYVRRRRFESIGTNRNLSEGIGFSRYVMMDSDMY